MDRIIDFFTHYQWHDLPIWALEFDFSNQNLRLISHDFEENQSDPIPFELIFKGLSRFSVDYPTETFIFELGGFYSLQIEKQETYYLLHIKADMPEKETGLFYDVCHIQIGFADLEVIGGLSREAMEYKWKVEEE